MNANTITCAWCKSLMIRQAGVDAQSHGICDLCRDEWQDDGDYQLSYQLARRESLKADIRAFQKWAWIVEKARRFESAARRKQVAA